MALLNELFKQQKVRLATPAPAEADALSLVKFESHGSAYLVPIANVREITEASKLVPYPEPCPGHLGLISLRGEILPVLFLQKRPVSLQVGDRFIVIELVAGAPFCLVASNIKKVQLPANQMPGDSHVATFNIEGQAAKMLVEQDLLRATGGHEGRAS